MTIDPTGMPIKEWCDSMVQELDSYGLVPILIDESQWRAWGQTLMQIEAVAGCNPPDPAGFDDFYTWAQQFNMTVIL